MRVIVGPNRETYGKPMKHDDIVVVPNFFCDNEDWTLYHQLIKEMREAQSQKEKRSEWIGWHENCHIITKNPNGSETFKKILEKTSKYFETDFLPEATRCTYTPSHKPTTITDTQTQQSIGIRIPPIGNPFIMTLQRSTRDVPRLRTLLWVYLSDPNVSSRF